MNGASQPKKSPRKYPKVKKYGKGPGFPVGGNPLVGRLTGMEPKGKGIYKENVPLGRIKFIWPPREPKGKTSQKFNKVMEHLLLTSR